MQGDRPNPTRQPADLTQLIEQAGSGSTQARTDLLEAVAGELRTIAASLLRRESDAHTLNATALVNESYLRLFRTGGLTPELSFEHRHAFFLAASTAMRRILIDHARAKATAKRAIPNAVRGRIDVDLVHASTEADPHDLLALAHLRQRGLPEVLGERQDQQRRERELPDRQPAGLVLRLGRMDAVPEGLEPEQPHRGLAGRRLPALS